MGLRQWGRTALVAMAAAGCAAAPKEERKYTQEEEMAAWMAVASPGPEHARMAAESGEWTVKSKMWHAPDAPAEEGAGTARMKMILGGRYQMMDFEGTAMGMTFQGMGITGYDNYLRKYVSSWCDSMGTMIMNSEGTMDASGKVLTMGSEFMDPLGRNKVVKMVSTSDDADHMHWEMFDVAADRSETKVMELQFTRRR